MIEIDKIFKSKLDVMKTDLRTILSFHKLGPFDIGADIEWLSIPIEKGSYIVDESKYLGDPHE